MLRRVSESKESIALAFLTLVVLFLLFKGLSGFLMDRVYPINVEEEEWQFAFDMFFYICIWLAVFFQAIWYLISWKAEPEILSMMRKWKIFFVSLLLIGILLPTIFIVLYPIESILQSMLIFIFYFIATVGIFSISTLYNYPEIRYISGLWSLRERFAGTSRKEGVL